MLAVTAPLPGEAEEDHWAFEMKWDGMRALAQVDADGAVRLWSRSERDVTSSFPDLAVLGERLGGHEALLDGEIVAVDGQGRASFAELQRRMHVLRPDRALLAAVPVSYLVFDLLRLDGTDATGLPYVDRRRILEGLELDGPRVRVPAAVEGDGAAAMAAAEELGMEGVVAKRLDSPYLPGARSRAWRKAKLFRTQEVVVAGWSEGEGRRSTGIGSLVVGVHDRVGALRFAGKVGTGFTDRMLDDLYATLAPLERTTPPLADPPRGAAARGIHWVEPTLVGEVMFSEWTQGGSLRQPSWRGLRPDKSPAEVVREP